MKKKFCLVIVAYPGKLNQLKKIIKENQTLKFVVFLNNFKKKYIIKNANKCFYLNKNITSSRIEMIKIIKKLNYDYFIFHDVDDRLNKKRPHVLSKYFHKYDFIINDINTPSEKKYFSKRLKNKTKLNYTHIKNSNFSGMTNSACSKKILYEVKFNKKDYKAPIFDWMFWRKIFKVGKGIYINDTSSFYDVKNKSITFLPTNYKNKKQINTICKIREFFNLRSKKIKYEKNNFWWEL